jgi:hypothetical protein
MRKIAVGRVAMRMMMMLAVMVRESAFGSFVLENMQAAVEIEEKWDHESACGRPVRVED